ncbi:origin recognition complex subunit 5 [Echinococcus multilocularis]|uniref:Origin recognition complex subunit 5 n=1 Tax=Echinococcus multilocularis TaxID=6211 RepID=A0A068YL15_ECHMU|nr:origin recognition complex subunit 5 [Echinococcus multilocularis]
MDNTLPQKPVAREDEFDFLTSVIGKDVPVSPCVVISGPPGCGKSNLTRSVLLTCAKTNSNFRYIDVSCLEVCPYKVAGAGLPSRGFRLFDLILHEFKHRFLPAHLEFDLRCDSAASFIENACELFHKISKNEDCATFCIILHQAEKLRDLSDNVLPIMVTLNSLVRDHTRMVYPGVRASSIVTVLLTSCPWDKFYSGTFASEPTCLYLKAYTREQLARILIKAAPVDSPRYARFIDILLTVCLPVTRNTNELLFLAQFNWKAFDEPVAHGLVAADDEWGQYHYALPTLKRSLSTIYLRPEHDDTQSSDLGKSCPEIQPVQTNLHALELPLYPRYLLLAAYIASYNPKKSDKRFLVKNTGKMSSRSKHYEKRVEYTNCHLYGPRLFPLDRLLAIFYALLNLEGVGEGAGSAPVPALTSLLLGWVGGLCGQGLLAAASSAVAAGSGGVGTLALAGESAGYSEDPLFNPRYRCLLNLETARAVAKSVNIDINRYLLDFV